MLCERLQSLALQFSLLLISERTVVFLPTKKVLLGGLSSNFGHIVTLDVYLGRRSVEAGYSAVEGRFFSH